MRSYSWEHCVVLTKLDAVSYFRYLMPLTALLNAVNYFRKKLHLKCLSEFSVRRCVICIITLIVKYIKTIYLLTVETIIPRCS